MTNPVDGVGSGIHFDVDASGLHDHAQQDKDNHDEESFASAPDINNLGNRKVADATGNRRQDFGNTQKTVLAEGGKNVGAERTLNALKKLIDKGDQVESAARLLASCKVQEEMGKDAQNKHKNHRVLGPDGRHGLNSTNTILFLLGAIGGIAAFTVAIRGLFHISVALSVALQDVSLGEGFSRHCGGCDGKIQQRRKCDGVKSQSNATFQRCRLKEGRDRLNQSQKKGKGERPG